MNNFSFILKAIDGRGTQLPLTQALINLKEQQDNNNDNQVSAICIFIILYIFSKKKFSQLLFL